MTTEAIEPAPWCKDAPFLVTLFGDGAGAVLVRGWDALCEELIAAHYHDPDQDQREEVLAYLTDWESWENDSATGLPYHLSLTYEDGSISVTRVTEDKASQRSTGAEGDEGMSGFMLESFIAEQDGRPLPMLVDLGYFYANGAVDDVVRGRYEDVLAAGVSRRNCQIVGHGRLFVKVPPRKIASFAEAFPIHIGSTYWRATHHWRGLDKDDPA
jgi:hypothetical protein